MQPQISARPERLVAELALVRLQLQMDVLVVAHDPIVGERRVAAGMVALEWFLIRMVDQLVALHFVRENHHRALIAVRRTQIRSKSLNVEIKILPDDPLMENFLPEQAEVPQHVILDLLAVVELAVAHVAGEELLAVRVEVQCQLLLRVELFQAFVALKASESFFPRRVMGAEMSVEILQGLAATEARRFRALEAVLRVVLQVPMLLRALLVLEGLRAELALDLRRDRIINLPLVLYAVRVHRIVLAVLMLEQPLLVQERLAAKAAHEALRRRVAHGDAFRTLFELLALEVVGGFFRRLKLYREMRQEVIDQFCLQPKAVRAVAARQNHPRVVEFAELD